MHAKFKHFLDKTEDMTALVSEPDVCVIDRISASVFCVSGGP